jgi:hypothetical protein
MTDVAELWRRRSDEQLLKAAGCLEEYTDEGQRVIRAELDRRGLAQPLPPSPAASLLIPENVEYSSTQSRAHWTIVLLTVSAVLDLVAVVSSAAQVSLINRVVAGGTISEAAAVANDAGQQLLGILQIIVLVVTVVAFLRWLSRSYRNLPALGVTHPSFTPGWAIGAWFVPFMNLVRPYQIVKELWGTSEPTHSAALLGWWWAAWLISGFIGQAVFRLSLRATQPSELLTLSYLTLISDAVSVVAAILAVKVVRGITRRQEHMRRTMATTFAEA